MPLLMPKNSLNLTPIAPRATTDLVRFTPLDEQLLMIIVHIGMVFIEVKDYTKAEEAFNLGFPLTSLKTAGR